MTPYFSRNIDCGKCERNIKEAIEKEEKSCDGQETVKELTYLGDTVNKDVRQL